MVFQYINNNNNNNNNKSETKLNKITFKSKSQNDKKENSTLRKLIEKYFESFEKFKWNVKYEYMQKTHDLIFMNNNNNNTMDNDEKTDIKYLQNTIVSSEKTPYLFMQITSINEYFIRMEILMDKAMNQTRKCYVKEIMGNNEYLTTMLVFEKGKISDKIRIDINEEHDSIYHFGLYNSRKSIDRIPNSNTIKSTILKEKSKYP
eukprot:81599_1